MRTFCGTCLAHSHDLMVTYLEVRSPHPLKVKFLTPFASCKKLCTYLRFIVFVALDNKNLKLHLQFVTQSLLENSGETTSHIALWSLWCFVVSMVVVQGGIFDWSALEKFQISCKSIQKSVRIS